MQKILNKLSTFTLSTGTKKEKVLNWFNRNEKAYIIAGPILSAILAFAIVPLLKNAVLPHNYTISSVDYFFLFLLGLMPGLGTWAVSGSLFSNSYQHHEELKQYTYQNQIFNYLKENANKQEVNEFLLKIKLINFNHKLNECNLSTNFNEYITHLENTQVSNNELNQATKMIVNDKLSDFLEDNKDLLEKNLDELKGIIIKNMANQLKKEREQTEKLNQFIDTYAENDDSLFKKEKVLKANL